MKLIPLLTWVASAAVLHAEPLTREQSAEVMARVTKLQEAFDSGDVATLTQDTHPMIYPLFGGKEAFVKTTTQMVQTLKEQGIRATEYEYGAPSALHRSGSDEVCFVSRRYIMHNKGRKIRSIGFLIAIRSEGQPWRFLDGAILLEKPEMLHLLLPGLPKDISLPENRFEPVE